MDKLLNPHADFHLISAELNGDKIQARHVQKIGHILNLNDDLKKNTDEDWNNGSHMKKVAQVPLSVFLLWESMGITKDPKELQRVLERNPEYKTTTKRLI